MVVAKHWLWESLTWPDLSDTLERDALGILPLGACEQHGPHLPLATDSIITEGILSAALEQVESNAPILVLPTQRIGYSPEHTMFPGTLSIEAEHLLGAWGGMASTAINAGLKRLLLFNGHGGQVGLCSILAQRLRLCDRVRVITCYSDDLGLPQGLIEATEQRIGLHAGQVETALMLALAPDLVQMEKAENFTSNREDLTSNNQQLCSGGSARYAWSAKELNESGAVGQALAATLLQGEKILAHRAKALAQVIEESLALPEVC